MSTLASLVRPGMRIALGDGVGTPRAVAAELAAVAAATGGVRLLLGWTPAAGPALDVTAFADVRTVMGGRGLRAAIDAGTVRALPVRLSAVPALLRGPLRPDVLVAPLVPVAGGFAFGTEVSWMGAAVAAGAVVAGAVTAGRTCCDAGPPLPSERVVVVAETAEEPATPPYTAPSGVHREIAGRVAALVPEGARLQVGPGALGAAVLDALRVPVQMDAGLLPDGVADLDRRGLLRGTPVATYLAGGPALREWADGRPLLHGVEHTHDIGRLSAQSGFVAVNTALEVDEQGQVNVEGLPGAAVGGIGGHADYAAAASRCPDGLSVVAVPATHRGRPTLVERLSAPVSTPAHDVDVLVTEHGAADLRGLDRGERAAAVRALWR
ncbi:acetyl-CoA hydrolase/transferase C-terminal domain-containing protein [Pseudonocardia sp.]|uniref:acetyl-CoA hydrolase/transferase C-terminal domain-containing protein n=1 Tax=Pseudonocardia sp. TaxID=60912 RepID=UPI003D0F2128